MKPSRYNHFVDLPASRIRLAFNAHTLALVEFREGDVALAADILSERQAGKVRDGEAEAVRRTLVQGGFLIADDRDELAELEARNRRARFDERNQLGLTIAPTLACNFRCTYCFQDHAARRMTSEGAERLLRWVERRTAPGKDLFVTWFGGEPLLALDRIRWLSRGFIANAERLRRRYTASMVTNGFLLTREVAKELEELRVGRVQVTLDGPREYHDRRRPLADRSGTYDTILQNLVGCHNLLDISLRINVDKENADTVDRLLTELETAGLKNRVGVYFGHVHPYTEFCGDIQGSCFARREFSLLEARLKLEMWTRGFRGTPFPQTKGGGFCGADSSHAFVIGPDGEISKCWNDLCDPGAVVSRIGECEVTPEMAAARDRWRHWSPFEKPECRDCGLLPICMGGCPYLGLANDSPDRGECVGWRFNLKEMIALHYLDQRRREAGEIRAALQERIDRIRAQSRSE